MVLQLTVFLYSGAVLGHVCLGLGVLAWGPCCSVGFSFSPNGALEFVLFCGRLAVSQYNFLFIHSTTPGRRRTLTRSRNRATA